VIPDLIYDIGMHVGNDTAHYLNEGFRVVAIEANPVLVDHCYQRFAGPLRDGRLNILPVGIAADHGISPFYVNPRNSEWSSFDRAVGWRDGEGIVIDVPTMPFDDVLTDYGIPYYMKIDIEMGDIHCLRALNASDLPKYLSVEAHILDYFMVLRNLGFSLFKLLDQTCHNVSNIDSSPSFPPFSSGPFGEKTPGEWLPVEVVIYEWLHWYYKKPERFKWTRGLDSWHDIHVKRAD